MSEPAFYTERVRCCVCHGTGKRPKLFWRAKDCEVCEGTGKREILLARNLSPEDRARVLQSAILGYPPQYEPATLSKTLGIDFENWTKL